MPQRPWLAKASPRVCPGRGIFLMVYTGRGIHDEGRVYLHHLHKGQGEGDEGRDGDHLHKVHSFLLAKKGRFRKWRGVIFDYCTCSSYKCAHNTSLCVLTPIYI